MRWVEKSNLKPKLVVGDTRTIKKFLFFPMKLGKETRWLETALINQKVMIRTRSLMLCDKIQYYERAEWTNISWAEQEK